MSQGSEQVHEGRGWYEHPDTTAIQGVVRGHLGALLANLAANPEPPLVNAVGRTVLGPPPLLPDDQQFLYHTCRYMVEQQGHPVYEFDETTYMGPTYISMGINGMTTPSGVVRVRMASSRNMVLVLLHEYGHLLRRDLSGQGVGEYYAEAFSYVVGAYFGVRNPAAASYIQNISTGNLAYARAYLTEGAAQLTLAATQTITTILEQEQP